MTRYSAANYRNGAVAFHWAMFVLVVMVGVLGLLHDSWPKQTQGFWINVHALIGILLWLVLLARFGYRLKNAPPDLPLACWRECGPVGAGSSCRTGADAARPQCSLYALTLIRPPLPS